MEVVAAGSIPEQGQLVRVRDRHWLVAETPLQSALPPDVLDAAEREPQHLVKLSSVDDDGLDDELIVIWELEQDAQILERATLPTPRADRFDDPERLAAFLDSVRWGAVASADARALQAPFRSGITIEDYQLDPVVRALDMPRVNLLIADDVGLGKTIEAGLVLQEMLLRHRARTVLILCPPALRTKWQREMLDRFGLSFEVIDADRVRRLRRERGVGANPFDHFPRAIVSFDWLKTGRPLALLRNALHPDPNHYPRRFDLLIVDEVHQCAPAGTGRYATDSLRTQLLRTMAPQVEHRLFLSATPHNGYESSYSALLELLDPQRFARGVPPKEAAVARVVVRRMKAQINEELGANADGTPRFPERHVLELPVVYDQCERDAHALLERYTVSRRRAAAGEVSQIAADLTTLLLKKRLFSSPAAFAATLDVHLQTLSQARGEQDMTAAHLRAAFDEVDDDFDVDEDLDDATERAMFDAARASGAVDAEQAEILSKLRHWADGARSRADAKADLLAAKLNEWCRRGDPPGEARWNDERVLIFTEYRATQKWLWQILTDRGLGGERLELLYGGMDEADRERIIAEFQADPRLRPVRILLATDTASEGIDLQKHCRRMVHVEIPFNPNRLEQRNGRIDRHGQPSPDVFIYHFVGAGYESRPGSLEGDLDFLSRVARKLEQIRRDLGDAGTVLAAQVERAMLGFDAKVDVTIPQTAARATLRRLERELRERIVVLRDRINESIDDLGIAPEAIERVVRLGLELGRQAPLECVALPRASQGAEQTAFEVPDLTRSWSSAATGLFDEIRNRRLPITFDSAIADSRDDVVLAHLGHRLVAQSLRLLRAEMWSGAADARLSRVAGSLVEDAAGEPALLVHGRLVIVAHDGTRLHEESVMAGGRLGGPGAFSRYNVGEVQRAAQARRVGPLPRHLRSEIEGSWPRIADAVSAAIEARGEERQLSLERQLRERADREASTIEAVLSELRETIERELQRVERNEAEQLRLFDAADEIERRQIRRDIEALRLRVAVIPAEIERESERLRSRYERPRAIVFPAALEILVPRRFENASLAIGVRRQ